MSRPTYCGDIVRRRFGPVAFVWIGDRRYLEIKLLKVWRRWGGS